MSILSRRLKDVEEETRAGVRDQFRDLYDVVQALDIKENAELDTSSSTGVVSLDAALGGKLPAGAVEIFGEASTGKSTLLLEILSTAQKGGMATALCPSETIDLRYMKKLGVDLNSLVLITGNCAEDVLSGAVSFLTEFKHQKCMLAIDSITALRPKNDYPLRWDMVLDNFLGFALQELGVGSSIILVNQVRAKRSIEQNKFFAGGTESYARRIIDRLSTRIELSRGYDTDTWYEMVINVVANIHSRPSSVLSVPVQKGEGVDSMRDLLRYGIGVGAVTQDGSWYGVEGLDAKKVHGEDEMVKFLETNWTVAEYLLGQVMVK